MPMFEYRCGACGHTYERYASGRKAGLGDGGSCPKCGKGEGKKVFSTFSACCGSSRDVPPVSSGGCGSHGGFS